MKHLYLLKPKITPYVKDIGDKGYFNMLTKSMKLNTLMEYLITSQKITLTILMGKISLFYLKLVYHFFYDISIFIFVEILPCFIKT